MAGGEPASEIRKKKKKKVIDYEPRVEIQAAAGGAPALDITHDAATSKKKKKKRRLELEGSDELASSHVDNDKDTSVPDLSGKKLGKKRKKKQCVDNHKAFLTQVIPMEQLADAKGHPSCADIALSCVVLSCLVLSSAVLSRHVLSCLGLSILVLSCLGRKLRIGQPSWADIAKEIAKLYVEKAQPDENPFKAMKERPVGPKQNSRVRNWMVAMRRNFRTKDKKKALAPFTITRDRMDEVRTKCSS